LKKIPDGENFINSLAKLFGENKRVLLLSSSGPKNIADANRSIKPKPELKL